MTDSSAPLWGPEIPHPLSKIKTELIWEGKYDEYGRRRPLSLPASPYPFQRIETIDEPLDRARALYPELFDGVPSARRPTATTSAACSSGATTNLPCTARLFG